MKKVSLMLGALGGAVAGYVFTNPKLRKELAAAKNPEEAGKIFAKHLSADGKKLGTHVKEFVDSDAVQGNLSKAKEYVQTQFTKVTTELKSLVSRKKPQSAPKKATPSAKKASPRSKKAL